MGFRPNKDITDQADLLFAGIADDETRADFKAIYITQHNEQRDKRFLYAGAAFLGTGAAAGIIAGGYLAFQYFSK